MMRVTSKWTYVFQIAPLPAASFIAFIFTLPPDPRALPIGAVIPLLGAVLIGVIWSSLKFSHVFVEGDMLRISSLRYSGVVRLDQIKSVWPGGGSRVPYIVMKFEPPLPCGDTLWVLPPSPYWRPYGSGYRELWRILTRNDKIGLGSGDRESEEIAARNMESDRKLFWAIFIILLGVTGVLLIALKT